MIKKRINQDKDMEVPFLSKSKSDLGIIKDRHSLNYQSSLDLKMEDIPELKQKLHVQSEMEESAPKSARKKSTRRKSHKSLFIEYSKTTNELRVIIQKIRGEKIKNKLHKLTTLKVEKSEKSELLSKQKDKSIFINSPVKRTTKYKLKTPKKSLKVKSKRSVSNIKHKIWNSDGVKKSPVKRDKQTPLKSTKRVLLKTMVVKEAQDSKEDSNRKLRSSSKPSKAGKEAAAPRTRSQRKKQGAKRDPSKSKRKVISKLVE